ncbi:WD40 repeat domain-containing protein [Aspergillus saccharolyticus JOP 1030-1]|uniref:WD40 repeat-like protein n=1 Tax=Aspergillus saccharolyticus JOP 1030-1 TaxID=1450539 RepID=A0A319AEF1_9EURO|nr:WD40 repeat-like protein [Aspergillus saccharolyticus JOP 1030-1]PYH45232.1 WD40 repeat-like protein [Aspergillus saccharolyticus JOP 1030-1]
MTPSTRSSRSSMLTVSHSRLDTSSLPNTSSNRDGRVSSFHLRASAPSLLEPVAHSKLNIHTPPSGSKYVQDPKGVQCSPFRSRGRGSLTPEANVLRTPEHGVSGVSSKTTKKTRPKVRLPLHYTPSGCNTQTILPDRYIPMRGSHCAPTTPFHIIKKPRELSPEEKLLRRRPPRDDPFMPSHLPRSFSDPKPPSSRICSTHYRPHLVTEPVLTGNDSSRDLRDMTRQISHGAVWNVGGNSAALGRASLAVPHGSGTHFASGTTAPMFTAKFLPQTAATEEREKHKSRVALALDFDPATRLVRNSKPWPMLRKLPSPASTDYERFSPFVWKDNAWKRNGRDLWMPVSRPNKRVVPNRPFRILDAPLLRDDFYCSTLAYSPTSGILAVGLGHRVYLWSEDFGVQHPPLSDQHPSNYVTSLAFSSDNGGKSILAASRQSGMLCLWSVFDAEVRFEISHPESITCVAFKQTKSRRLSERFRHMEVDVEDLAVGDDLGNIWYYSVEWPDDAILDRYDWSGAMTLLAKIAAHTQQICGISWSPDGSFLATGGNDNFCLLFELQTILPPRELNLSVQSCSSYHSSHQSTCRSGQSGGTEGTGSLSHPTESSRRRHRRRSLIGNLLPPWALSYVRPFATSLLNHTGSLITGGEKTIMVPANRQKHRLLHGAAVKAIAFAPWQPSLLATGGGSNDRTIHFYHAPTGACLATIHVYAQVTGLIWSKTRREIVATFGFAQPEHPYRIAVFAWPTCEQIAAIPWGPHGSSWDSADNDPVVDCGRALCAVSYPGRPHSFERGISDETDDATTSSAANHDRLAGQSRYQPSRRRTSRAFVRPRAKEGGLWCSRTMHEGCIIVASSDQSVKFHEVWSGSKQSTAAVAGSFGGSGILEGLEGLEKPGDEIIR